MRASESRRVIYFSNTFSIWPIFFWILPASFSSWPSDLTRALPVTRPAASLRPPFTSWILPLIRSVVLGFMLSPLQQSLRADSRPLLRKKSQSADSYGGTRSDQPWSGCAETLNNCLGKLASVRGHFTQSGS